MTRKEERTESAVKKGYEAFKNSFNCAQSTFAGLMREFRPDDPAMDTLMSAIYPFAGGGCRGDTCGGVNGAHRHARRQFQRPALPRRYLGGGGGFLDDGAPVRRGEAHPGQGRAGGAPGRQGEHHHGGEKAQGPAPRRLPGEGGGQLFCPAGSRREKFLCFVHTVHPITFHRWFEQRGRCLPPDICAPP